MVSLGKVSERETSTGDLAPGGSTVDLAQGRSTVDLSINERGPYPGHNKRFGE